MPDGTFQAWLRLDDERHYILTLTMCWTHLRSISHNMDSPDKRLYDIDSFIQRLAYCLYLPTLFLGPLILYPEFLESVCIETVISCVNINDLMKFVADVSHLSD